MRDVDFGHVRLAVVGHGHDIVVNLKPLNAADARSGGPYLTVQSCDEVNAACNLFFKKRNMKVGKDYCKEINNK